MKKNGGQTSGKKRIFILLIAFSLFVLAALAAVFLFMAFHRESIFTFWFNILVVAVVSGVLVFAGIGVILILFTLVSDRCPGKVRRFFIHISLALCPLAMKIGSFFRIDKDSMWTSFVALNNQLVLAYRKKVPPERLLLLLPHCLQRTDCGCKVTADISLCAECDRCNIGKLKEICTGFGIHCIVSTGGTLARQAVKNIRPKAVVAVACGRDLFSGIMDIRPIPTLGVLNERPEGPCRNTCVDPGSVLQMISYFLRDPAVEQIEGTVL